VEAALSMTRLLISLFSGTPLEAALAEHASNWFSLKKAKSWLQLPDATVIGQHLSPACYLKDALPATLYLAWKYAANLPEGLLANAQVGGDNCHRGALLGALLGALCPQSVPEIWKNGLLCGDFLRTVRLPTEARVDLPNAAL
jgi:ADP-ribosylglycohydrolase